MQDERDLQNLISTLKESSKLNFTHEKSDNGVLPFLDVRVQAVDGGFKTSVYTKSTNTGMCMNGESECPTRYHASVIRSYTVRAITHASTWVNTHQEFDRISQVLINNGFSNKNVEKQIRKSLEKWYDNPQQDEQQQNGKTHKLFLRAFMSSGHKEENRIKKHHQPRGYNYKK